MRRRRGVGRAGRPSLVGTAARTAVTVGTANAVTGNAAHRQPTAAQTQPQPVPAAPAALPAPAGSAPTDTEQLIIQLQQLGQLHQTGILTDQEFADQKARIL